MTEILINVVFGHPAELVWRALTERRVLSAWFMPTDLEPVPGRRFRLLPGELLGLAGPVEGEVVEVAEHRLVMLWRGEQLHARVTWALEPILGGCRLTMAQTGFVGSTGSLRRRELRRTFVRLLGQRLPAVLDKLADGRLEVGDDDALAAAAAPVTAASTVARLRSAVADGSLGSEPPAEIDRRRFGAVVSPYRAKQLLAVLGTLAVAVVTAWLLTSLSDLAGRDRPAPGIGALPGPSGSPVPTPTTGGGRTRGPSGPGGGAPTGTAGPGGGAPTGTAGPGGVGRPDGVGGAGRQPVPPGRGGGGGGSDNPKRPTPPASSGSDGAVAWAAVYQTTKITGRVFRGQVTVSNVGTVTGAAWRVTLSLAAGERVLAVTGADVVQVGRTVTLTTRDGAAVPPGGQDVIRLKVKTGAHALGPTAPLSCSVNGTACTRLPVAAGAYAGQGGNGFRRVQGSHPHRSVHRASGVRRSCGGAALVCRCPVPASFSSPRASGSSHRVHRRTR